MRSRVRWLLPFAAIACQLAMVHEGNRPNPQQAATKAHQETTKAAPPFTNSSKSAEDRLATYTLWLTIFTGALVGVSAFQGYYIRKADATATMNARAASDSAKAALVGQRAFVYLNTAQTRKDNEHRAMREGALRPVYFINFGSTPARVVGLTASCRRWEKGELTSLKAQPPGTPVVTATAVWLAGGGNSLAPQHIRVDATEDEISRTRAGDGVIALVGHLDYTDVFDAKHEFGFAYYLTGADPVNMNEIPNPELNYSR